IPATGPTAAIPPAWGGLAFAPSVTGPTARAPKNPTTRPALPPPPQGGGPGPSPSPLRGRIGVVEPPPLTSPGPVPGTPASRGRGRKAARATRRAPPSKGIAAAAAPVRPACRPRPAAAAPPGLPLR